MIVSNDINHILKIIAMVRDTLRKSCGDSKKTRKETFRLFFNHHDLFSITTPLLFSESNEGV